MSSRAALGSLDILKIRSSFRLPGTLTGANGAPPLLLTKCEVRLLLELKAAVVSSITDRSDARLVAGAKARFAQHQSQAFESFGKLCHQEKLSHIHANRAGILRKFRERNDVASATDDEIIEIKVSQVEPVTLQSMPVQLFAESPFPEFKMPVTASGAEVAMDRASEIRYLAFRHVWHAGYYLTPGTKFACDFLVYEHDPCVCHAKYMLFCREREDEITGMEVLLKGRLSVQVGKDPVFAIVRLPLLQQESPKISFMKLVWEGKRCVLPSEQSK